MRRCLVPFSKPSILLVRTRFYYPGLGVPETTHAPKQSAAALHNKSGTDLKEAQKGARKSTKRFLSIPYVPFCSLLCLFEVGPTIVVQSHLRQDGEACRSLVGG